jgi:hypothetical protein
LSSYKTIVIDNINFQLVKDAQGDTSFIGTSDKAFMTPDGFKIGMSLQQIKKIFRVKLQEEPGWGYYIELPSKWNLQFVVGQTATDHAPADTNKGVIFLSDINLQVQISILSKDLTKRINLNKRL